MGSATISPGDTLVEFSDNITFQCGAQGGPDNMYQWSLNNITLSSQTSRTLQLFSITLYDAGKYTCTVSNIAGMDNASAILYIYPRIISHPQDVETLVFRNVTFACEAEGFPVPDIVWNYPGRAEQGSGSGGSTGDSLYSRVEVSNSLARSTLEISPVLYSDFGPYFCVAVSMALMMDLSVESDMAILTGEFTICLLLHAIDLLLHTKQSPQKAVFQLCLSPSMPKGILW